MVNELKGKDKFVQIDKHTDSTKKYISKNGIIKLKFGNVLPTDTILNAIEFSSEVHYDYQLNITEQSSQKTAFSFELNDQDVVYGLGQNVRGMNKRGFIYESFCSDDPNHTPDKVSLYGAHNFFVVAGKLPWGIYIDFPGKIRYDVAFSDEKKMTIEIEGCDFDVYFFSGTYREIVKQFRELIGLSYVPPKWAFGYQQSRWSYENATKVLEIADQMDAFDIPCDAIYLDIDYMDSFKDFTINEERFPEFEAFVREMKDRGLNLVPIIDAGVKIEKGYSVYEEGIKNRYFCTDKKDEPFVAAVWPGKVHFPDFMNPEVRTWFGAFYHEMIHMGIEGFWNDMNEPAIFYSEEGLKNAIEFVKAQEGKNLDIYTFFELKDKMNQLSNSIEDYKSMYHNFQNTKVDHYTLHNLYGYNMTRAADEGFKRYDENKRFLLLTRASHIGMAKHSGIWTGDNHSWWEHLKLNVQMMPALNMAGFLYSGADTGGFGCHASGELMIRWLQFSIFTPLLRNHSAMGTRFQEPWQFGMNHLNIMRDLIRFRYAFIPYLYSEFMKANLEGELLFAPLAYSHMNEDTLNIEDQLCFGDSLMLAPIVEQNSKGRSVYIPAPMLRLQLTSFEKLISSLDERAALSKNDNLSTINSTDEKLKENKLEILNAGYHYIKEETNQFSIYQKQDKLLVLNAPENRVSKLNQDQMIFICFVNEKAEYTIFDDDGVTKNYTKGIYKNTKITVEKKENARGSEFSVSVDTNDLGLKDLLFYIFDSSGSCHKVSQKLENCSKSSYLV